MKFLVILLLLLCQSSCGKEEPQTPVKRTKVIVLVMDGARFSETIGDSTSSYTPFLNDTLGAQGVICTNFYNRGVTETISGHASITTGHYEEINNSGRERPRFHSLFQRWRKTHGSAKAQAWIVTSKDKLAVLTDCKERPWRGEWLPSEDCGIAGKGTGYRADSSTFLRVLEIMDNAQPDLLFINFMGPDVRGHSGDWNGYLASIKEIDSYASRIWSKVQQSEHYKNSTVLIVTNDHGRHLDGVGSGFVSHGDSCEGCRHIALWAIGPDIQEGVVDETYSDMLDLHHTLSELLEMPSGTGSGRIITSITD